MRDPVTLNRRLERLNYPNKPGFQAPRAKHSFLSRRQRPSSGSDN